ncbi:DUF4893 domain-containing protein [Chelativorans sp. J32]|uniref:DUF4893 domain-containing protein n=1 Tax=Chelativorans sp. J32 TaxID=935840 RepID=UPI000488D164|nr:DUF4893 domain-containing protein [Chelativorans sp. J32]
MFVRFSLLAFLLISVSGIAHADGEIIRIITKPDSARLKDYETTRQEAVAEAEAGGSPTDVATFKQIISRPALSFDRFDIVGEWQCRTIKAGGLASLVIYDWFRCRVTDDGSGWTLEKLSGSQRTKGRFFDDGDKRLIYLGAFFIAGETPPRYGLGPETDQAGYVFRDGQDHWRIEFPAPARESKLDILEFRRSR